MTDTIVRGAMRMSARGYYTPDGEMKEIYCDVTLDAGRLHRQRGRLCPRAGR